MLRDEYKEEWKTISSHPPYLISNHGRIFSRLSRKILSHNNYENTVSLSKSGTQTSFSMHRLTAQYFIPNPYQWDMVCKKNGGRNNCHITNLYWYPSIIQFDDKTLRDKIDKWSIERLDLKDDRFHRSI